MSEDLNQIYCRRSLDMNLSPSKVAYLLIGMKNTGKNVTMQILMDFFGYGLVSRTPLLAISKDPFQKPLLEGKLINFDDEIPKELPLTESREIKSLTGGKFHTLNPKNIRPYSGVITALLVFAGNQFPKCQISRNDSAFWDRWQILYFEKKAHKVDEGFMDRLLTPKNLSGFFNHVINKLFEIHGKEISRTDANESYMQCMYGDKQVAKFIHAKFKKSEQLHIYPLHELYKHYEDWYIRYEELCKGGDIPADDKLALSYDLKNELESIFKIKQQQHKITKGEDEYGMAKEEQVYGYSLNYKYYPELDRTAPEPEPQKNSNASPCVLYDTYYIDGNGNIQEYEDYPEPPEPDYPHNQDNYD
jgi:phage/plasmid-associated DNA primase